VGSALYFSADGGTGVELWRHDGTTLTQIEINPGTGSTDPQFLTALGNTLYLSASD
jgi:ELWxxDGT repeat protein